MTRNVNKVKGGRVLKRDVTRRFVPHRLCAGNWAVYDNELRRDVIDLIPTGGAAYRLAREKNGEIPPSDDGPTLVTLNP